MSAPVTSLNPLREVFSARDSFMEKVPVGKPASKSNDRGAHRSNWKVSPLPLAGASVPDQLLVVSP